MIFGPTVRREQAMGSRNTDTCIPNVACLRKKKHTYIPTFGRSVNKAKTNIALYVLPKCIAYMPAKTKSVHTVSQEKAIFLFFGKSINLKKKPALLHKGSNLMLKRF